MHLGGLAQELVLPRGKLVPPRLQRLDLRCDMHIIMICVANYVYESYI